MSPVSEEIEPLAVVATAAVETRLVVSSGVVAVVLGWGEVAEGGVRRAPAAYLGLQALAGMPS
ncbi:MAG: hypothetical protein WAL38_07940 [Solirubrobacteraceae bacterium]